MFERMESRPAFTVLGLKYRGRNDQGEVPLLWEKLIPRAAEIQYKENEWESFGVMDHYDPGSGEFEYLAGYAVTSLADAPEDMTSWDIPDQIYAVFRSTLAELQELFHYAYQEWLPDSAFERGPGPEFELYDPSFCEDETLYLYLPVIEKKQP